MTFQQAVKNYTDDPTKENLEQQVKALRAEMTEKEKIHMLSGHTLALTQKSMITAGRNYNYYALPMGGCKRLGIPSANFTDGPRGVVMAESTCFPVPVMRAASFDADLEYRIGKVIADEAIAQDSNYFAGICINLAPNPRWGRSQESYGEDPYLLGEFGAALTRSVQEEGMMACPKHFALNSIEDLRFFVNVDCDDRTLHEVYLPHFKKCVVEEGALSIMGAYNRFREFHCCENKELLTDILRKEWGFDGFVISDFVNGVQEAEHSLRAGCDIEMMFTMKYNDIPGLLKKGKLHIGHIDRAVDNILRSLLRSVPKIKPRDKSVIACEANRAVAREAAEKGMVLLENNGTLPLSKDARIAVLGAYANQENTGDYGSSRVYGKGVVTPYAGIQKRYPDAVLAEGLDIQKATAAAANCDTVIITAGSNREQEGEFFKISLKYATNEKPSGYGGDRATLRLADEEVALIRAMKKLGKRVIVVLYSGSVILTDDWKDSADAVLMNFYSGVEGGTALANILSGGVNPSGKMPVAVAHEENEYPPIIGIGEKPYETVYGYYHGYTLFDKRGTEPAYPFGYGLSYTTFDTKLLGAEDAGDTVAIRVQVTNTGNRSGAEVVQVYAGSLCTGDTAGGNEVIPARFERPKKLLKGFRRVELQPGEAKEVTIPVKKEELKFYDPVLHTWDLDKAYRFYVGNSCKDAEKQFADAVIQAE